MPGAGRRGAPPAGDGTRQPREAPKGTAVTTPVIERDAALALLAPLTDLVVRAGEAILAVNRRAMDVIGKADGSPVTEADLAADAVIAAGLTRLAPDVPALSEERTDQTARPCRHSFFLIDPLDGTREFVAGHGEFTVNLALITDGRPLLGIVGAPALGLIWRGVVGQGAERMSVAPDGSLGAPEAIRTRAFPGSPWIAAVSRSHGDARTEAFIDARPGAVRQAMGSAVKFCRVAEGSADIYPRLAPTCEWDVAAGHAVLTAAGGRIIDTQGQPIRFGETRDDFIIPEFIAFGDGAAATA
ncbi:3'(2'),5'-bisphosphate nucleotidase CysQ [Bradyrhizobium sp. U87765 SZCCT0131]|nr:3'(2'),5'-bisphosphate nucleotidase CysQ [Bradyrhizobium sp. U87765 SZCCT0131]MBR1264044.1 3'(2'),5'-bisphosphate nucleotidase CysQ [Bradyrhizobium sp. U87765 SZCCT0134]MBR1308173.1 3'(2'),5'-bisphosphate nucleotidase CysQ [Bradyrhizobium sp. U87765 SZCCT0110]MBR1320294.1 3'(2'),5'-bisphosphate nucleotidase CysQ [Bradyrhizobium sp. U87765 SZCCT0109]MBR1348593.1 3'(2'),5'-bisphosphate nucleotidase CysQ [Bradyrhizobium sp. U87765 SZCCT0048]